MSGFRVVTVALGLCAAISAAATTRADILWDQGPGDEAVGWISNTNSTLGPFKIADDFTFSDAHTIRSIEWWAISADATSLIEADLSNVASYTIEFFTDAGGVGSLIASEVVPIGSISVSLETTALMRMRTALGTPLTLAPGTYWVAINATLIDPDGVLMTWAERDAASPQGNDVLDFDFGPDGAWDGPIDTVSLEAQDAAFRLIPAPDASLLALSGLLLVGLLRRNVTS